MGLLEAHSSPVTHNIFFHTSSNSRGAGKGNGSFSWLLLPVPKHISGLGFFQGCPQVLPRSKKLCTAQDFSLIAISLPCFLKIMESLKLEQPSKIESNPSFPQCSTDRVPKCHILFSNPFRDGDSTHARVGQPIPGRDCP